MALGQLARRVLGKKFKPFGEAYRRIFVDLDLVAEFIDGELPKGTKLLDVGGGDGALIERLLDRRPDLSVTMCDIAPTIGEFLGYASRLRVKLLPDCDLSDVGGQFDAITICDVVHHVPKSARNEFFRDLRANCDRWGCRKIIFKDIEPGSLRATLSQLADRYITGDKHVELFSSSELDEIAANSFPNASRRSVTVDPPNYGAVLTW